jgi:hypothetical protein
LENVRNLADLEGDGWIILKLVLKKDTVKLRIGFKRLKIGSVQWLLYVKLNSSCDLRNIET